MAINWGGVAGTVFFYVVIFAIGIWASRKTKGASSAERVMLADRQLGWVFSAITLTGEYFL